MIEQFELRRQSDDLVYRFNRRSRLDGIAGFQRMDQDLWVTYRPALGWVAWDEATQSVMGRPWEVLPTEQSPDEPPQGVWVSRKGVKSYVYDLVHI
ncbi:MAG: hypothetical protein KKF33_03270 [Alphaproteobacteria bacterium]|nr:hypothetical protein [Alphaproteobacteria bacterium]